ncbi:hypothetical protein [Gloeobacter morelensis]|uniref:DUF4351 domain-containing protein n=1 Tax=Gloeobacter morelensis MG652769 TaxID=2781736 RepID=A0ABY3PM99_9CYAN|nr:hypothetical protein [Gloeobacter morelensis]UFP94811.1 hypothetical protein ISF26_00730 [Gloeobacter morelensis MG652769]
MAAIDRQVQSTQQRAELLTVTLLLASIRVHRDVLRAFVESRAMFDLLQDTPLGQQLLQEAERRGEQQGQAEGLRRALVRALTHRFGNLSTDLQATLNGIDDSGQLEQLLDLVLDAPDLDAFRSGAQL